MRPISLLPALALGALLAPAAPAAAPAGDFKIAYVDLPRALNEVDEGKIAKAQLKKDFDQKQKRLDEVQESAKRLKADFDKQSVVMSDDVRRDKQQELDRKMMEVQGLYMQLQKELSEREEVMTRGIFDKMGGLIREIAEAESITMVLEKNRAGVLYAPASLDLTNDLVRRYNSRFKPGADAAAKKPDAAAKKADKKEGKK